VKNPFKTQKAKSRERCKHYMSLCKKYRRLSQLYEIKALQEYEKGWPEKYKGEKNGG
jgi:hypothetical protein